MSRPAIYSDDYIARWRESFLDLNLRERLHITFEQFLADPGRYLPQVPRHPLAAVTISNTPAVT